MVCIDKKTSNENLNSKAKPKLFENSKKNKVIGTADYMAPEVLLGENHTFRLDFWAIGVITYELLTGALPFNDDTPEKVFKNILNREIKYPPIGTEDG